MAKKDDIKAYSLLFFTIILMSMLSIHNVHADAKVEGDFEYEATQDYYGNEVVNITNYIGTTKEVIIPDEIDYKPVNFIMGEAFKSKGLTKVDIGANVTYIGDDAFSDNNIEEVIFGKNFNLFNPNPTFANNPLKKIIVDENNPNFKSMNEKGLYRKNFAQNRLLLGTISGEIANDTEVISNNAFFGIAIKDNLVIPDSVETIKSQAFYNSNVKSVGIGKGLKNLDYFVFSNNPLETVIVNSENANFKDINKKGLYSKDGTELKLGTISGEIAEGTVAISSRSFSSINVKEIDIPSSVQIIDRQAFSNTPLEKIIFPTKVNHDGILIGNEAFASYSHVGKLKGLEIPETIKQIGNNAFTGAIKSGVLRIKGAKEGIGINAFSHSGIEEVYIETKFNNDITSFPYAFDSNKINKIVIDAKMNEYTPNGDFFNNPVREIYVGKEIKKLDGELVNQSGKLNIFGFSNLYKTDFYKKNQQKYHFVQIDSAPQIDILHDGKTVKKQISIDAGSAEKLTMEFSHEIASMKNTQWKVDGKYAGEGTSLDLSPLAKTLNEKTVTLLVETEYGAIAEKGIKLKIKHLKEIKPKTSIKGSVAKVSDVNLQHLENKGLLNIDLSSEETPITEIKMSKEQISNLIHKKATIQIKKNNVILNIPVENLRDDLPVSISINQLEKNNQQFSNGADISGTLFEFSIKQGDKLISSFTEPIELVFPVTNIGEDNPENLKVYYWNEKNKEWELIGGEYRNGYIHALTDHFSIFGLFHPEEIEKSVQGIDRSLIGEGNEKLASQLLPKTATNNYNLLLIGITILLIGGLIYFRFRSLNFTRNKSE